MSCRDAIVESHRPRTPTTLPATTTTNNNNQHYFYNSIGKVVHCLTASFSLESELRREKKNIIIRSFVVVFGWRHDDETALGTIPDMQPSSSLQQVNVRISRMSSLCLLHTTCLVRNAKSSIERAKSSLYRLTARMNIFSYAVLRCKRMRTKFQRQQKYEFLVDAIEHFSL